MVFAQNFGDVVGTYEGHLPLSECRYSHNSFWKGGDTWTLFWVIKLVWTFCTEWRWGAKNENLRSCECSCRFTVQWFCLLACWHAVNVYGVVILVGGVGDTWTLLCITKLVWTFCTKGQWGARKENYHSWSCTSACANSNEPPKWNYSLLILVSLVVRPEVTHKKWHLYLFTDLSCPFCSCRCVNLVEKK